MSGSPRRAWAALIGAALARAILLAAASLLIWGAVPALWGWLPTTVSSDSMAPGIRAGDVVVSMPVDANDLHLGQVLLVADPDHEGRQRLHRLVGTTASGELVLRGDANQQDDSTPVQPADVSGVGVLRVPWVGLPGLWLREGAVVPLALAASSLLALGWISRLDARYWRPQRPSDVRRGLVVSLAVTLLVLSAATVGLTDARAAFSAAATNPASSLSALASYPCLSPAPAVSAYLSYPFGEVSGATTADSSGNLRSGTLVGGATRVAGTCIANSSPALQLNGTTGQVTTPTSMAGPNVFTLEIWFKTTTTVGGKLIGFGNSQAGLSSQYDRHLYLTNSGQVVFGVYPGSVKTVTSAAGYNNGAWHLATATLSAAGMALYLDGTLVGTNTTATTGQAYTGYWRIGYDNLGGWTSVPTSRFFAGTIDSPTVYLTALSAAQVSASYAAGH
ncbi:MAG: LamG-like jellyroll fold domain-containing protein [Rhodoglobus sp.]